MDVRRARTIVLSFLTFGLMFCVGNAGAALRVDQSFGHDGVLKVSGTGSSYLAIPEVLAAEPDGGLILARESTLQRLDPAGNLDSGFGEGGTVTLPPPAGGEFAPAAATVDAKGRIVVVGTSTPVQAERKPLSLHLAGGGEADESEYTDLRILRYLPNGSLDPSFGDGGIVESDLGLPTPESEKVKLSAAPVVEATGIAIEGSGRIVVTGGAGAGITDGGCFHDDYFPSLTYAGFVARFTETGSLDGSFATGGVFGGRSKSQNPLGMEVTTEPVVTSNDEVIVQRGTGHCPDAAGSLGFFKLSAAGQIRAARGVHALHGRVGGAAAAPDGSTVLLVGPQKGSEAEPRIVELRPNGSPDRSFGGDGSVALRLPDPSWSYANDMRVAPDGEVLVAATIVPPFERGEGESRWWARFSVGLVGLTAKGAHDPRIGPKGMLVKHIPGWYQPGGLWLDGASRPTVTIGYRPKRGPVGLAAVRFGTW
jgi:uncharacterized delta-60 repeat protein